MQIYTIEKGRSVPKGAVRPYATLTPDNWNDFGYKTLFELSYYPTKGGTTVLGAVKIASRDDEPRTALPKQFETLPDGYFSLGQSMSYYHSVRDLPLTAQRKLLLGLRDVVFQPAVGAEVEHLSVFRTSLIRFSESQKVYREAGALFQDQPPTERTRCSFRFSVKLPEAGTPHELTVLLGDNPTLPDRILALIGKNGTGKTWLLGRLAAALSGDEVEVGTFTPGRPAFQRVIAVSYSAFDRFNKPTNKRTFSYRYCGIYDKEGKLHSRLRLLATLRDSAAQITKEGRRERWESTIEAVLNRDVMRSIRDYLFPEEGDDTGTKPPKLSSGQLVLVSTITELLAAIESESMILFDEPELHQHPNAVAGLMESLHTLLDEFDSYAILATHSPLVVQQIPSGYVRVFTRTGNATLIREPVNECFGENLTTITQEVFQTSSSPSLYTEWLKKALGSLEEEEIMRLFPKGLSFNALSVMQSLK